MLARMFVFLTYILGGEGLFVYGVYVSPFLTKFALIIVGLAWGILLTYLFGYAVAE
jgi:hypothetical protein